MFVAPTFYILTKNRKLGLDRTIIQAGAFDQSSGPAERERILKRVLEDDDCTIFQMFQN